MFQLLPNIFYLCYGYAGSIGNIYFSTQTYKHWSYYKPAVLYVCMFNVFLHLPNLINSAEEC